MIKFDPSWYSHFIRECVTWLGDELKNREIDYLEVGAFEGESLINAFEKLNIREATVIDNFAYDNEGNPWCRGYSKRVRDNIATAGISNRVSFWNCDSRAALSCLTRLGRQYDFVYIDADHHPNKAVWDVLLGFECVKPGGYMLMDDYLFVHPKPPQDDGSPTKPAIDALLDCFALQLKVIKTGWGVLIQKL